MQGSRKVRGLHNIMGRGGIGLGTRPCPRTFRPVAYLRQGIGPANSVECPAIQRPV